MCAGSSIACNFVYNTLRIVQLCCTERILKFEIGKLKFNCWNLKKAGRSTLVFSSKLYH